MEANLCVTCFVDDDRHLVKVGGKGLETFLRYRKLRCDEKLEKVFSLELLIHVDEIIPLYPYIHLYPDRGFCQNS